MNTIDAAEYVTSAIALAGDDPERLESVRQGLQRMQVNAYRDAVTALAEEDDRDVRALLVQELDARLDLLTVAHDRFTDHLLGALGRREMTGGAGQS